MFGALFRLGEQKVRPNVYVRFYNDGDPALAGGSTGIAAAVVKTNWGPLNKIIQIDNSGHVKRVLGENEGSKIVEAIFRGGVSSAMVVRAGVGGEKPEGMLKDDSDADAVRLVAKYPTSRIFNVTIREALNESDKEFILYEGSRQIERLVFNKGDSEVDNLLEMIASSSEYLDAFKIGTPSAVSPVVAVQVDGGSDPEVTAADYVDAFSVIELKFFDGICVDSEDPAIHASLHAFVQRKLQEGFRVQAVVGEGVSVPFETRVQNARSFNDFVMYYVGNGFETTQGYADGALAAAHVLGILVSSNYKTSLTKKTIQGSVGVYGELTPSQYIEAARNGMMVFSESVEGLAQIDYGINTLVATSAEVDEGWKKSRRVKTRFELIDRISHTLAAAMREGIDNNADGRQHIITIANGIINTMIAEGGLESGQLIVDPDNSPVGDSAWFKFDNLVDLDGVEKLYIAFGFKY